MSKPSFARSSRDSSIRSSRNQSSWWSDAVFCMPDVTAVASLGCALRWGAEYLWTGEVPDMSTRAFVSKVGPFAALGTCAMATVLGLARELYETDTLCGQYEDKIARLEEELSQSKPASGCENGESTASGTGDSTRDESRADSVLTSENNYGLWSRVKS